MQLRKLGIHTLLVFASLLCVHYIVSVIWNSSAPMAASQWGENTIRSERVIYTDISQSCIVVGSSISARLDFSKHNMSAGYEQIFNLAYAGDSATTGLSLLLSAGKLPKCVLVESNLAYKLSNQLMIDDLTHSFWMPIKQWYEPLRHENQPLNQLLTFLKFLKDNKSFKVAGSGDTANTANTSKNSAPFKRSEVLIKMIDKRVQGLRVINYELLEAGVDELFRLGLQLAKQGVIVVYIEMPGEPEVRATPYYSNLRSLINGQYESVNSHYSLPLEVSTVEFGPVTTSDGIHLTGDSIHAVSRKVVDVVEEALEE